MNNLTSNFNAIIVPRNLRAGMLSVLFVFFVLIIGGTVVLPNEVDAASNCSITRNLSYGDRGSDVSCLQTSLGVYPDGYYGPLTQALVNAYQANHGLVSDGVFGYSTLAIWSAEQLGSFNPNPNLIYPIGCTSNSGYSQITSQPCNGGMSVNNQHSGCLAGYTFSVLTGQPCFGSEMVTNLPIGCSTLSGYSYVTGYRCDNQIIPNPYILENLSGGSGDILVTSTSVDVEKEIREGKDNQKILGFRIEADGSDVRINSVRVSFENNDSVSSPRLDRYIEDVSIYMNDRRVGSADVGEFNESNDVYSENIELNNAVVREGTGNRENFYVAVTVNGNISDQNLENDDWQVSVERNDIRFTDGNGSVQSAGRSGKISSNPDFVSTSSSSSDASVRIAKTQASPRENNIKLESVSTTNNVPMLVFTVRAEGSDITFDSMDFDVEANGVADVSDIISQLAVYQGSKKIGDITSFDGDDTYTINFYNQVIIDADDTETFTVKANVKRIGTSYFANGDSLRVSTADPLFDGGVLDENDDEIDNVTGSADGETQTFYR